MRPRHIGRPGVALREWEFSADRVRVTFAWWFDFNLFGASVQFNPIVLPLFRAITVLFWDRGCQPPDRSFLSSQQPISDRCGPAQPGSNQATLSIKTGHSSIYLELLTCYPIALVTLTQSRLQPILQENLCNEHT